MSLEHFVALSEVTEAEIHGLLGLAARMKADPAAFRTALAGKTLGMIFQKSSTRTRVSFEVGIAQLGGVGLFLSARDLQLGRGEPIRDTARVLSRYLDGIMARTYAHADVVALAEHGTVPVINGLTDFNHPCQALSDLLTVHEHVGAFRGRKLAYIGDGNNMAHSLMMACAKVGMDFACATPEGYEMDAALVLSARDVARAHGSAVLETEDPHQAAAGAHAVYTDVWASMGQEAEQAKRVVAFADFTVDEAVMAQAADSAIFMHCLPAHRGEEVSAAVCDGPRSVIIDQAENRLHAQKAVMATLMAG